MIETQVRARIGPWPSQASNAKGSRGAGVFLCTSAESRDSKVLRRKHVV